VIENGTMLRRLARGLFREQRGSSAFEYMIFLCLLVLTVAGGAVWLGVISSRSWSSLADPMQGRPSASSSARDPRSDAAPAASEALQTAKSASPNRGIPASLGAFVLGAGAIGLGWFLLARQRPPRCKRKAILQVEHEPPSLSERLSAKRQSLLRLLSQDPTILFRNQLAVRHLMTTNLITVSPATSRQRLGEMMRETCVRHMLVCGPDQQLLGLVSDRDLCGKPGMTAADLMTWQLKTVTPETLISPATTQIIHAGISALPVVEEGRLCGILTTIDLILALQSVLQLWYHAASMMQGEAWEQEFMQTVEAQLETAETDTCYGVKGVVESLMKGGQGGVGVAGLFSTDGVFSAWEAQQPQA
jgi:CBS-domain-containing membrane protein